MRGKDYNAGLRGVLFEARHYERMGAAIWLYGWLVLRQTRQEDEMGWVLGGAPITYREIEEETGFNPRTLERWMHALRRHGYIQTEAVPAGVIVRITKAKKFPQGGRNSADRVRKVADTGTQICGASSPNLAWNHGARAGIGSSSLERSKERLGMADSHNYFHRPNQNQPSRPTPPATSNSTAKLPGLGSNHDQQPNAEADFTALPHLQQQQKFLQEARLRLQLLRAEREEAVRRELAVGTGPEVQR